MFNLIAYFLFVFLNLAIMQAYYASIQRTAAPYVDYECVKGRLYGIRHEREGGQFNAYRAESKERIFNVTKAECRTTLRFAKLVFNLYLVWESVYIIATLVVVWLLTKRGICLVPDSVDIYGWTAIGVGAFGTTPFLILIIKISKYTDSILEYDQNYFY